MVSCTVALCKSRENEVHNGRTVAFFHIPVYKPLPRNRSGKAAAQARRKAEIRNMMHMKWREACFRQFEPTATQSSKEDPRQRCKHREEETNSDRLLIAASEAYSIDGIDKPNTGRTLLKVDETLQRAAKRAKISETRFEELRQDYIDRDKIKCFRGISENLDRLTKQWTMREEVNCLYLTRSLKTEISSIQVSQQIRITPCVDKESVNLSSYTPMYATIKETASDWNEVFVEKVDIVEQVWKPASRYSEIYARIRDIETNTATEIECGEGIQTVKTICSSLRERAKHLLECCVDSVSKSVFYQHTAEQLEMLETPAKQRCFPDKSFVLANAHQLMSRVPGQYSRMRENMNYMFLPDKRTLFTQSQSNILPPDCIFAGRGSAHSAILSAIVKARIGRSYGSYLQNTRWESSEHKIPPKHRSVFALHLDEVNIRQSNIFANKTSFYGPAYNNPDLLATNIQAFLVTPLSGKRMSLNLMSRPVAKQTGEDLYGALGEACGKADEAGFDLCPIIFDGCAVNRKALRLMVLRDTLIEPPGRRLALPQQELPLYLEVKGRRLYAMFCLVHIVKYIRNNLIRPGHTFVYPEMVLSTGFKLPAGECDIKWVRRLYQKYKNKLFSPVRINRKTAYPSNLEMQQVAPALLLSAEELTNALRSEFGEQASGTYLFLEMVRDFIIQPFLKVSSTKGKHKRLPRVDPFVSINDPRLREAEDIAFWLQKQWYAGIIENHPEQVINVDLDLDEDDFDAGHEHLADNIDNMLGELLAADIPEPNEQHANAQPHVNDPDHHDNANEIATPPRAKKNKGRVPLKDGLSPETFFTLAHTLRSMAGCSRYLLSEKGFDFVLPGRMNNDPIEKSFSVARAMAGGNRHLDVASYIHSQRTLLVRAMYEICLNSDMSHNRERYDHLFLGLDCKTEELEAKGSKRLQILWKHLTNYGPKLADRSLCDATLPYVGGYAVHKWVSNSHVSCTQCKGLVEIGKDPDDEDKSLIEYRSSLMEEIDRKGLIWPTSNIVILTGLVLDVVDCIISDRKTLKEFKQSACASQVGVRTIKHLMDTRIKTCRRISSLIMVCDSCGAKRYDTIAKPLLNTLYNIACNNMSMLLNRQNAATVITLSMVKTNKGKNMPTKLRSSEGTTYVQDNSGLWSSKKCKEVLRSAGAVLCGDIVKLRERCKLLLDLQKVGLEGVLSLPMSDARRFCRELDLIVTSKTETLEVIARTLLDPTVRADNDALLATLRDE